MGGAVPGVDAVTVYLPRERHVKGRTGKYWAFGPLTVYGLHPLEQHSAAGPSCAWSSLHSAVGLPRSVQSPTLSSAFPLPWSSHSRFDLAFLVCLPI